MHDNCIFKCLSVTFVLSIAISAPIFTHLQSESGPYEHTFLQGVVYVLR